jgi:hypothetical protein
MRSLFAVLLLALHACGPEPSPPVPACGGGLKAAPPEPAAAAPPPAPIRGDRERYCSDQLLPKQELCDCLSEMRGASCSYKPVGAGFGIFTSEGAMTWAVHELAGGMLVAGFLDEPGYESWTMHAARIVELGGKPILQVEATEDWFGDGSNATRSVSLCLAREPGAVVRPRCLEIPLAVSSQDHQEGTHEPIGPITRSRLAVSFTPRGEVVVRAVGKLRHPDLKKLLGKHRLE